MQDVEQVKCWIGTQEVCMLCPSCQRFPTCSEAAILCIHVINPVFNMTKVGFSFSLVFPNCILFEVRVSYQAFIQCLPAVGHWFHLATKTTGFCYLKIDITI